MRPTTLNDNARRIGVVTPGPNCSCTLGSSTSSQAGANSEASLRPAYYPRYGNPAAVAGGDELHGPALALQPTTMPAKPALPAMVAALRAETATTGSWSLTACASSSCHAARRPIRAVVNCIGAGEQLYHIRRDENMVERLAGAVVDVGIAVRTGREWPEC